MPGMGVTPTPGTGTAQPRPGMGTTPTPGSGTAQPRPGMGTTPTPNTGTSPMMPGTGATTGQPPFIYEAAPGTTTPPMSNGTPRPTGRSPLNPQSMTTPATPNGIPSGMQSGVGQEMPYYYNPNMPYMTGNMPCVNYAPYQGIPNMYLPNSNAYNVPMGIPLFPLYGYDNSADLDHDVEYMKQLYPRTAKAIQKEIDNECDQMEYDGSMMFDEYPDKEYLDKLIDRVYDRIKQIDEEPQVEMNSLYFYPPRRNQNYLRDVVSLLLLSEIFNRRRRHRGRKRWF
jgi:hypothetical protein